MTAKRFIPFLLTLLVIGCGVSPYRYGMLAWEVGDYQRAITALQDAVRTDPEALYAWQQLGVAYYLSGEYEAALPVLERAYRMDPTNAKAAAYLAMTYERTGRYEHALVTYDRLAPIVSATPVRQIVEFHRLKLKEEWYEQRLSEILTQQEDTEMAQTVIVMPVANLSVDNDTAELAETFTYLMRDMIRDSTLLPVMDAFLVYRLLAELGLQPIEPVDVTLGAQIGRRVGRASILTSTLRKVEPNSFQFNTTLIQTKSGEIHEFASIVGTPTDLVESMRTSIGRMVRALDDSSDSVELQAPTDNPHALIDFARGRKSFDAGEYERAATFFQRAIEHQPDFWRAKLSFNLAERFIAGDVTTVGLDELEKGFLRDEVKARSFEPLLHPIGNELERDFISVEGSQRIRGDGNQRFPGTDRAIEVKIQWR